MRRSLAVTLAIGIPFVVIVLVLTLSPRPPQDGMPVILDMVLDFARNTLGWTWLGFTALEQIANVLVFVPVGILAALVTPRPFWPLALLVGPALSLGIEAVQALALAHRSATWSDLFMNSLGATIGVLLVLAVRGLRRSPQPIDNV